MKGQKIKTYIVRITGVKNRWKVRAYSANGAIAQVWYDIRPPGHFKYGMKSLDHLKRNAKVERV